MHAVWRQGLYHHSTSSSSPNATATSATVSLQAWNAADPMQQSRSLSAMNSSNSSSAITGEDKGKRTLTPAQRMREYREKLKRNPEVYQRYKQMNALRSRLARMRRTQEQIERDREKARQRNLKNRGPSPRLANELDLMALTAEGSALDFSLAGPVTPPPTHLLHEPPARLPYLLQDTFQLPQPLQDSGHLSQSLQDSTHLSQSQQDGGHVPQRLEEIIIPHTPPDNITMPHSSPDNVSMPHASQDSVSMLHTSPDHISLPHILQDPANPASIDVQLPSCSTEDWEPSVSFEEPPGSA